MPWQKPKTDWAVEDGVMNDDLNRIEGNIEYLFDNAASQAAEALTYYVAPSPTGNDANDGLTAETPFATIQRALDAIPKNLNGFEARIVLAHGSYNGFTADGYSGGTLTFTGAVTADIYIMSEILISNCYKVQVTGMGSFIVRSTMRITDTFSVILTENCTVSSTLTDAVVVDRSNVIFTLSLSATGASTSTSLVADNNSNVFVESLLIGVSGTGIEVDRGSKVSYSNVTNRATSATFQRRGGRILTGSTGGIS